MFHKKRTQGINVKAAEIKQSTGSFGKEKIVPIQSVM